MQNISTLTIQNGFTNNEQQIELEVAHKKLKTEIQLTQHNRVAVLDLNLTAKENEEVFAIVQAKRELTVKQQELEDFTADRNHKQAELQKIENEIQQTEKEIAHLRNILQHNGERFAYDNEQQTVQISGAAQQPANAQNNLADSQKITIETV